MSTRSLSRDRGLRCIVRVEGERVAEAGKLTRDPRVLVREAPRDERPAPRDREARVEHVGIDGGLLIELRRRRREIDADVELRDPDVETEAGVAPERRLQLAP